MKIAIYQQPWWNFATRWVEWCEAHQIAYELVNPFSAKFMENIKGFDVFMTHWRFEDHRSSFLSKYLTDTLPRMGLRVFPNHNTIWHYEDKAAQSFLFKSINAPSVPTYVFYERNEALNWARNVEYPKVFKLRTGAGSSTVRLIRSEEEANVAIKRMFGKGDSGNLKRTHFLKESLTHFRGNLHGLRDVATAGYRCFFPARIQYAAPPERDYVYFQDFIAGNTYDIRTVAIGDRAFSFKRMCRQNDFRASGSHSASHTQDERNRESVKLAFKLNEQIQSQCLACDFVFDSDDRPLLVEISCGFARESDNSHGYYDRDLRWHEEKFKPQDWIIENLLQRQE